MIGSFAIRLVRCSLLSASIAAIAVASAPATAQAQTREFDIPAQPLSSAILEFSRQSDVMVLLAPELAEGRQSRTVRGPMTSRAAIGRLLSGTGLRAIPNQSGGYRIGRVDEASSNPGEAPAAGAAAGSQDVEGPETGVSEILIVGRRSQNADIPRTEDDAQPYVVFSHEDVIRSGAINLQEFFRTQLPMNSQRAGSNQLGISGANVGGITLRGLSADQTLILVDGRRVPGVGISGAAGVGQPNINGIPPSAIERIEVLPATAGGIYGGSATGGAINIVLKRDYSGLDLSATYGNAFDSDVGYTNFSLSGGLSLESGRTRLTFSASRSKQNELTYEDRDFQRRARELNWANRRADFTGPTLSYTPNFCSTATTTSTTCSATPLVLDPAYGGAPLGSNIGSVPVDYPGLTAGGVAPLVNSAGRFNLDPASNVASLYSAPELESYSISVRRNFGRHFEGFLDFGWDHNRETATGTNRATLNLPASHPDNPFQQNIAVVVPIPNSRYLTEREVKNSRARAGVIARLPHDWSVSLEHSRSISRNSFATRGQITNFSAAAPYLRTIALRDPNSFEIDPTQLGVPDIIRDGPFKITLGDTILRFSGPTASLPGGPIIVSGYLEQREEAIEASVLQNSASNIILWFPPKTQRVRSAYVEARAPILSRASNVPLIDALELFVALRRDEYDTATAQGPTIGGFPVPSRDGPFPAFTTDTSEISSNDYTFGMRYAPFADLTLRASFGTGFLPPNLGQITASASIIDFSFVTDPMRGDTPLGVAVNGIFGGSPDLRPEESRSFSAGLIFTPRFLAGLRVSVDYVRINKRREISTLSTALLIQREGDFAGRVVRGPNLPGDPAGWAGPITQIDGTSLNIATTSVEAYDFQVNYDLPTARFGTWRPYLIASMQTDFIRRVLVDDVPVDAAGFSGGPLEWRANFGLSWDRGPWSAGWDAQYVDSYKLCAATATPASCATAVLRQGSDRIPSQLYHSAFVGYNFGPSEPGRNSFLSGMTLRFGIQNLFNRSPPIIAAVNTAGYDLNGDPRLRRFMLTLQRHF